jgi:hypothetical protein
MTPARQPVRGDHNQIRSLFIRKPNNLIGSIASADHLARFQSFGKTLLRKRKLFFGLSP